MTHPETHPGPRPDTRLRGLRANSLAALVMLLIQYGLGMGVNLYASLPRADHGKGAMPAFAAAVAHGPVVLTLHALLGTLLLITAISVVVRAVLSRGAALITPAVLALLAILTAWLSGARFVGSMTNGASLTMALATALALLGYALIVLVSSSASRSRELSTPAPLLDSPATPAPGR